MSHLPQLRPEEIEKILLKAGFIKNVSKSSHRQYIYPEGKLHTTVSFHSKTVPPGTLRAIIKQSGMTSDEFLSLRKRK